MLHFKNRPPATRDEAERLSHVDWIAHGCEVVQSHFPDRKFQAALPIQPGETWSTEFEALKLAGLCLMFE